MIHKPLQGSCEADMCPSAQQEHASGSPLRQPRQPFRACFKHAPVKMTGAPGHARGKSSSAPAAPLLASAGEHTLKSFEAHGASRSSPDTPLSDRLNRSYSETFSRSGGSRVAKTGAAASLGSGGAGDADEASCSASGSLSDRSINVCFTSTSPGRACRGAQSPLNLLAASGAAAALQRASLQETACSAVAAGPNLAFKDPRGFCDNPFARNRSSGAENARQLRRKLSGKSGSHGQPERHRLGRQGGNGLAQGQLSLLLKQQQEESRPAVQSDASHGSRRKQHSLLSMQLKGLGNDGATIALGGASPPPGASGQQRAVVCRATSAVDPLRAPCPVGSPHHAPPARFWQATLAGASSAPRPNLASTLREPHVPGRRHPMAMSDGLPGSPSCSDKEDPVDQDEEHLRHRVQNWLEAAIAVSGHGLASTPLPHHTTISPLIDRAPAGERTAQLGKQLVSPEAMELIQAMDKSLVTPARSESGFPGPLTLPVDISGNVLTGGFQAVCAGFSPAGRHARVPPRQVSGQLTNLQRARTCQGSLPDPDEVLEAGHLGSWAERVFVHLPDAAHSQGS